MKKMKAINRIASLMLAVFVAFGMLTVFTEKPEAEAGLLKVVQYETLYEKCPIYGYLSLEPVSFPEDEEEAEAEGYMDKFILLSVKSSNTKVLKAKKQGSQIGDFYLVPKKAGNSMITIQYQYQNSVYTVSKKVKVKKYPNPIKSVKVNGSKANLKKHKFEYEVLKYKKNKASVKITPAKGWKVVNTYRIQNNRKTGAWKDLEIKKSVLTKGSTIKLKKGYDDYFFVDMKCTKGKNKGDTFTYVVRLYRNGN